MPRENGVKDIRDFKVLNDFNDPNALKDFKVIKNLIVRC